MVYDAFKPRDITSEDGKIERRLVERYAIQEAQLSQRDRAAGCVIVFAKSRRLQLGDNILPTL